MTSSDTIARGEVPNLPTDPEIFATSPWEPVQGAFRALAAAKLDASTLSAWLDDWTRLHALIDETYNVLAVAAACDTENTEKEKRYQQYVERIQLPAQAEADALKRKLVESGLAPEGFTVPLRQMRADIEIFREANQPLKVKEHELRQRYRKITGAQMVEWDGERKTVAQLGPVLQETDRARREAAWRAQMTRWLQDRDAIDALWAEFLDVRLPMAANAGFANYRDYAWKVMGRFDYSPADCAAFRDAIEQTVVPAARRIYAKRRARLGVDRLRPWDLNVEIRGSEPLRPFANGTQLEERAATIFERLDPVLGGYFGAMRAEGLLDLENREGKAPGGFCTGFDQRRRPFILMNAVGIHNDVQTMLHEAGHAFHAFEVYRLPHHQRWAAPMEFCEVASMSMELLAAPCLSAPGAFYSDADAARARIEHLEEIVLFWPYMAVVDAFQHWVYEHPADARDARRCDAMWAGLWARFMDGVDWTDLETEAATGWHRKLHIHLYPFYYVEYGLAQLGAVQVFGNSLADPTRALAGYKRALAIGAGTLPELFAAADVKFAFDARTLGAAVNLVEQAMDSLEGAASV
ncbi:MAG: M3 family oligoendopeptidase [Deltaproteobacteria bacterium]|nr:M3 family oligoendopeptidase [Deltaproteobacteria bacterium]